MKFEFCVIGEKPTRVDMFLSTLFKDFSRSYVQKIVDRGQVTVNGEGIAKNVKIKHRDEISITLELETIDVQPENMNLDIVYEDDDIIFLNKEAGVNVHPVPGEGGNSGTLVNGVLYHCKGKLPSIGGVERPGIVHRLDKDTSGLIMIAKNDKMMNYLSETIKDRKIDKYYIAIVFGQIKDSHLKIESYIGRHKDDRTKMTALAPVNGKLAITYADVIDYIDNQYTILKVKIETGRTHQIRVHMASIGYPIIGDKVYGNAKANIQAKTLYQLKRQALHAYELDFELNGEKRHFSAALKDDMKRMIGDKLDK